MKTIAKASIGIGFGALLLWAALSQVDVEQGRLALGKASVGYMLLSVVVYWVAIAFRIARWRVLLSSTTTLSMAQVGQALIVGYAVNNVLPARLGEIFRADFVRRRFDVTRSAALGSILVERLMDGVVVLILLGLGLATLGSLTNDKTLVAAAIAWGAIIVIGLATVYALTFWHQHLPLGRAPWLAQRVGQFVQGMMVIRGPLIYSALALTAVGWCFEATAIYLIMRGFGVDVGFLGTSLTIGAAALSTLLPSAPGYIGSLQFAFVLAYSALGAAPILGVLSATAVQLLLLGSITLVGLGMLLLNHLHGAAKSVRQLGNRDEERSFGAPTR